MALALIGFSHHNAPIEVRERLSYAEHALPSAYADLARSAGAQEAVILSTCNRMEVYVAAPDRDLSELSNTVSRHLSRFHQVDETLFAPLLLGRGGPDAARHLMRVACGLDSLVLGETQILGQVRQALRTAQEQGAAGRTLTRLFEQSIAAARRVQGETELGRGAFSIGHVAVDLAGRIFDDLKRARVLILGAGKMCEVTARHLVSSGVRFVMVANRTHARAVSLAEQLGGTAISFEDAFQSGLAKADIVIASTAAPHTILRRENLAPVLRQRRGRPLFLIDIAVPRDIDSDVNELDNVFLYNIDDLQDYVAEYARGRALAAGQAERLVQEEAAGFMTWYYAQEAAPVITELRGHLDRIREEYMEIFAPRLAHLSERDQRTVEALVRSLMDQVAREPILRLKEAAVASYPAALPEGEQALSLLSAARKLFSLKHNGEDGASPVRLTTELISEHDPLSTPPALDAHAAPCQEVEVT